MINNLIQKLREKVNDNAANRARQFLTYKNNGMLSIKSLQKTIVFLDFFTFSNKSNVSLFVSSEGNVILADDFIEIEIGENIEFFDIHTNSEYIISLDSIRKSFLGINDTSKSNHENMKKDLEFTIG